MRISGIYKIINLANKKIYVGSAVDIKARWRQHKNRLRKHTHENFHLQNAWNKYGEKNFVFELIEELIERKKLIEREQYWLDRYCSYRSENGYNILCTAGSPLGRKLSEETKKKISKTHTGKILSDETKRKLSEINKGKKHTKETRKKISESHRGENNPFYGKKHSVETKRKLSERKKGKNNPNYGKPPWNLGISPKDETKEKISKANSGENAYQAILNEEQVKEIRRKYIPKIYTQKMLAEEYGVSESTIQHVVNFRKWKRS